MAFRASQRAFQRCESQAPKGAKVKTVDRRMKADLRGEKKARKRNPGRFKARKIDFDGGK